MSTTVGDRTDTEDRLLTRPFLLVTLSTLAFFVYVGVMVPLVPRFAENELGGGELAIGLNLVAFSVAAVLIRPLLGPIADRRGRRALMVGGCLLAAVSGALTGLSGNLGVFLALRALAGIGEAAQYVGAATIIADLSPPHRRAEGASYFSAAVFGGIGIGPVFGEAMLGDDRFVRAFMLGAIFTVVAAAIALLIPDRVAGPGAALAPPVAGEPRVRRTKLLHPAALLPGCILALGIAGMSTFTAFVPDHARDIGLETSSGVFVLYSVVCLVVRLAGARLPERIGLQTALTIALGFNALGLVTAAAVASPAGLYAATLLIAIGISFQYPSLNALAVNAAPDSERAAVLSSFTMFFEIGVAFAGITFGSIGELTSKRGAFLAAAGAGITGLVLVWTVLRQRTRRPLVSAFATAEARET